MKRIVLCLSIALLGLVAIPSTPVFAQHTQITPRAVWTDTDGQHIQAHGGGILRVGDTYYWYGEQRRQGVERESVRYVSCYSSTDLMNWKNEGDALCLSKPDSANLIGPNWVLERPKVYRSQSTGKYVMYMHIDGRTPGSDSGYGYARVGVAVSDSPTGPFSFVRTFRPFGKESRDIGQFVDDDGTPYLIFESRPTGGFYIARLTPDCLDVADSVAFIHDRLEGGGIVHYRGLYYCVGSGLTGWNPNPNKYATATKLEGPWSEFRDLAPADSCTYGAQSTLLLKVEGSQDTTVVFLADVWRPDRQWDSRYLWMPCRIGDGSLQVPQPKAWSIDVKTGKHSLATQFALQNAYDKQVDNYEKQKSKFEAQYNRLEDQIDTLQRQAADIQQKAEKHIDKQLDKAEKHIDKQLDKAEKHIDKQKDKLSKKKKQLGKTYDEQKQKLQQQLDGLQKQVDEIVK